MRFMIIVKSTPEFEAETPPDARRGADGRDGRLPRGTGPAGVLLDASGLHPSRKGWRVHYGAEGRRVIDGPFAEAKELIAGYTLIQVRSREEALEWSAPLPQPGGRGPGGRDRGAPALRARGLPAQRSRSSAFATSSCRSQT